MIVNILQDEGMSASKRGIVKFLRRFGETGTIANFPGSGRPSKATAEDKQMHADDKTTAYQLYALLNQRGYSISLRIILRCRTALGWMFRGSTYCQLILEVNKQKRLK